MLLAAKRVATNAQTWLGMASAFCWPPIAVEQISDLMVNVSVANKRTLASKATGIRQRHLAYRRAEALYNLTNNQTTRYQRRAHAEKAYGTGLTRCSLDKYCNMGGTDYLKLTSLS